MKPTSFIVGKPDCPTLPDNRVDPVFLCNGYHHLEIHADPGENQVRVHQK